MPFQRSIAAASDASREGGGQPALHALRAFKYGQVRVTRGMGGGKPPMTPHRICPATVQVRQPAPRADWMPLARPRPPCPASACMRLPQMSGS
eukprot:362504-Chlamydomonas_euryale.AAC.1